MRTPALLLALPLAAALALFSAAARPAAPSVFLEALTWTEVRDALQAGTTTVIIPVGGTEQNGPHMALGKHNVRVRALAGRIAAELGHTLVAPVLAYVPEGSIAPPAAHMRYAGTISVSDDAFKGIVDGAARSLRQHGFRHVVLLGDHGGYQPALAAVAARLNREWASTTPAAHVHYIADYYRAAQAPYTQALRARGLNEAQIGTHAGAADTALMLALDPTLVRTERLLPGSNVADADGVAGDPRAASAALGQIGVELIVSRSVAAIRNAVNAVGGPAR
jgi:creatinine amidohydrolase/Fe(II)-dependent formamide hydrolase-like protein